MTGRQKTHVLLPDVFSEAQKCTNTIFFAHGLAPDHVKEAQDAPQTT